MAKKIAIVLLLTFGFTLSNSTIKAADNNTDTVTIYFAFGSPELSKVAKAQIRHLSNNYSLQDVDSVSYTGVADSVGSIKANIKLSMRRAKAAKKYARYLFRKTPVRTAWRGEGKILEQKKNRKVEIVLYYKLRAEEKDTQDEVDSSFVHLDTLVPPLCYDVAYDILAKCHNRTISKRRKKYQLLEYYDYYNRTPKDLYYGIKVNNKLVLKKVKWRGGSGYFEAHIPKTSFTAYKIFRVTGQPCSECSESFENENKISLIDTTRQVDHLLMHNMQYKRSFLSKKIKQIRVPREYIDPQANYFIGCDVATELIWKEKKGRKKKQFLYVDLKTMRKQNKYYSKRRGMDMYFTYDYFPNIMKVTKRCSESYMRSWCEHPFVFIDYCGTNWGHPRFSVLWYNEYSRSYNEKAFTGLGLRLESNWSFVEVHANIQNPSPAYHIKGTGRLYLINIPISYLNPLKSWHSLSEGGHKERYVRLYGSVSHIKSFGESIDDQNEISLNIGLECFTERLNFMGANYYMEIGTAHNFANADLSALYPVFKVGTAFRLYNIR